MVVSFDIYRVLNITEYITWLTFLFFFFLGCWAGLSETQNAILKLCLASLLLLINLFQVPIEVQLHNPYGIGLFIIIILFIYTLRLAFNLGKDDH